MESVNVGGPESRRRRSVLAEGAAGSGPPWVGREIELGVQRRPDADGKVLPSRGIGDLLDQLGIADSGESQRFRPLAEVRTAWQYRDGR